MKASRHVDAPVLQTLEPYPEMKDSGVPALGNKPVHWQVLRVKNLCRMRSGDGITAESITPVGAYPVYGGNGQRGYTSEYTHDGTFVLIGRQGALCGNVHLARGRFWASEHAVVTTVRSDYLPEWLGAILTVMDLNQYSIAAAQPGLSVERVLDLRLPVPPVSEQAAIVRVLDHADRRIRRYIRAQKQLVMLLEEQKQAIIHQAITGQIDVRTGRPFPAYKPSGVPWLGDVPTHWAVRRARYIFREIDERSQEGAEQHLSMSQRLGLVPSHLVENRTLVSESYAGGKLCRTGDLVLNRLKAHLGVFARAQQSGVISADYTVLRSNRGAEVEYFEELLRSPSCRGELRIRAKGIVEGFWRLYTDDLYDIYLPLPPEEEQRSIIRWIESVGARIERSSASGNREIVLLYEYRARLIADVVTGKLDVREAAAGLPDVDPLAAEEDPDDGSNLEARLDGDEVGATVHEAEA